jgi:phage baseplate assembly protein W|tara:strand:- start:678 stop:1121 length:444 start_codon:yes stop_codon:yes gene_type:complete
MVTKAFAVEDGNLSTRSLITTRNKLFSDIDLTFTNRPSGDLYKKTDAAAVKQAVKNLLLTNHYEKPFQPFFGGDLNNILFELVDNDTAFEIEATVREAVARFEPRALVLSVAASLHPSANTLSITVNFQVVNTQELVTLETNLTRLR